MRLDHAPCWRSFDVADTDRGGVIAADGVGFEPTSRLRDRWISSPVHSTALPPILAVHLTPLVPAPKRLILRRCPSSSVPQARPALEPEVLETRCVSASLSIARHLPGSRQPRRPYMDKL